MKNTTTQQYNFPRPPKTRASQEQQNTIAVYTFFFSSGHDDRRSRAHNVAELNCVRSRHLLKEQQRTTSLGCLRAHTHTIYASSSIYIDPRSSFTTTPRGFVSSPKHRRVYASEFQKYIVCSFYGTQVDTVCYVLITVGHRERHKNATCIQVIAQLRNRVRSALALQLQALLV